MLASDVGLSTYEDGIPVDPQMVTYRLFLSPSQVLMRVLELPVEYLDLAAATRMETKKTVLSGWRLGGERSDWFVGPEKQTAIPKSPHTATHRRWIPMTSWI